MAALTFQPRPRLSVLARLAVLLAVGLWGQTTAGAYDTTVCGRTAYTIPSNNMTFNADAWNPDVKGFQCISVQDSPPAFAATWSWSSNPGMVHSYPHVKLMAPGLPTPLSNISALVLSAQWSMGPGPTPRPALVVDHDGLANHGTSANVAFDLFLDRNVANARSEQTAETEVMIWVGRFGYAEPLGFDANMEKTCFTQTVGDAEFVLYQGQNERGTDVLSWVATANHTNFAAEVSPLLQFLWRKGLVSAGSHLGLVEFGSEAYHSDGIVTFAASEFDMHLVTGAAPNLAVGDLPAECSRAASTNPPQWLLSSASVVSATLLYLIS
ncbi:concanavalin A-like lectin/glucanase domain-containing protein [Neurospora tetraspora]|uniref:Concanavalin A-like lectin/glucanase domain-containing protein n=1 Tax=Neurospora tetraspora TaxID=94610 RepID=A0AAE0J0E8_9PEZI|nr:concanavalin A-like lectin/glucanase domain-containing protein [Neurospora tetraspora]